MAALEDSPSDTEAPTNRLFVGNLSWGTDGDSLSEHFEGCSGFVGARVVQDRDSGRSKGFGFVEFTNSDEAVAALENMAETELDGRSLLVRMSTPNARRDNNRAGGREYGDRAGGREYGERRQPREVDPDTTLYVGNLPYSTSWQELKEVFSECGGVAFVDIPGGRDGRPRGFATVRMESPDAAEAAIEQLNGQELGGRQLVVRKYEPRPAREYQPREPREYQPRYSRGDRY